MEVRYKKTLLPIAKSEEEYEVHCAAVEWSLADPIVISSVDDVQSRAQWSDDFQPFRHQVQNLITFCRCLPVTLVADDVGLGKTITAAIIIAELMKRRRVSRTLILCPNILTDQWREELAAKVGVEGTVAKGDELDREFRGSSPVVITTYQSARSRLKRLPPDAFDFLILDEAHTIRNLYGVPKPPIIASEVRRVLAARLFTFSLMLTATPIHNRIWDLYSLVDCLTVAKGSPNPLGTPDEFQAKYIADNPVARRLRPEAETEFREHLRKYLARTRRADANLAFPTRHVEMFRVQATSLEVQLLRILAENIRMLGGFQQSSLAVALMSSPQAFEAQLKNMAKLTPVAAKMLAEVKAVVGSHTTTYSKQAGLLQIVEQLRSQRPEDWRLLVFTSRRETQGAIGRLLSAIGVAYGFIAGSQPAQNAQNIAAFSSTLPSINVLVSTDAGGQGVNLQACNVLVNYDLPWNPMVVEQRIGRVQRLASPHKHVTVFNLCIANSPEEHIVGRLIEKLQTIFATVGDIDSILQSAFQDDAHRSFSEQLLDLVIKSLEGQDTELAARLAEDSIEKAKDLMLENEKQIDEHLGRLDELHTSGPFPPQLPKPTPRLTAFEFVRAAVATEGGELCDIGNGQWIVERPGQPNERAIFDERHWKELERSEFMVAPPPKLYRSGKPAFENLVSHWSQNGAAKIRYERDSWPKLASKVASSWLTRFPTLDAESVDFHLIGIAIEGHAIARVTASTGVDGYEKLLEVPIPSVDVTAPDANLSDIEEASDRISLDTVHIGTEGLVVHQVEQDSDINAFCDFYEQRLRQERQRVGAISGSSKQIEIDLKPTVEASIVAFAGEAIPIGNVVLDLAIDGHSGYSAVLRVCPTLGQVVSSPAPARCEETGALVPEACLSLCEVSQKRVLPHLLIRSDASGRRGLKSLAAICEESGTTVFREELGQCALSGKQVAKHLLAASEVTGKLAIASKLLRCEITGTLALPDELIASEISGRSYRSDQQVSSSISGVTGHLTEFAKCEETGQLLLTEETLLSDFSAKRVRRDLLVASGRPPHRKGLQAELTTCSVTGRKLLLDEVACSVVSGRVVDRSLLVQSDKSDGMALEEEMVYCEVSGHRLLPSETQLSSVSGKRAWGPLLFKSDLSNALCLEDESCLCAITETRVLHTELALSEVSGLKFRKDQASSCSVTGKVAHISELERCSQSGQLALRDEMGQSAISGSLSIRSLLTASDLSGRLGCAAKDEVVRCAVTGKTLLLDEVSQSAVSDRYVDRRMLIPSEVSGKLALPEELVKCEMSGKSILPIEREQCEVTGKLVDARLLAKSEVSGRSALASRLSRCDLTGRIALPSELARCEVSSHRVVAELLEECSFSAKSAIRSDMVTSAVSGRWLIKRHAITTYPNGVICHPDESTRCSWIGEPVLATEAFECQWTGLTFYNAYRGQYSRLSAIESLLANPDYGEGGAHLAPWLEQQVGGALRGLTSVRFVSSPNGALAAFCCDIQKLFKLSPRIAVFMVKTREGRQVVGNVAILRVQKHEAFVEKSIAASPMPSPRDQAAHRR
ncbi:ATP-dependent helicase HepA [Posidoniimonas corsicana]|uniref:ATP-dependent helicase HepA n=1 Tax=Posidoniimonas corsicana TaxID=1938618 RepID=A0A5C5V7G0_9BACT|nr:SNF2-related protein [Posidoniimonas corsicana]TWT33913.1 ATP-dependent helicase HepA [Posidoniimonas corsicana]